MVLRTSGNWTRQPASQPAVTTFSLGRRSTMRRIASSGANKMAILVEAAVTKATTAAAASPVRDLHWRARQQDDGRGEQDPQRCGPDVPGAGVENEQRASCRNERPGKRERYSGIRHWQV